MFILSLEWMSNEKHDLQPWDRFSSLDILVEERSQYQAQCHAHGINVENDMIEIDESDWWSCWEREKSNELLKDSEKYHSIISLFYLFIRMISLRDILAFWVELVASRWKEWSLKSFGLKSAKSNAYDIHCSIQSRVNESYKWENRNSLRDFE